MRYPLAEVRERMITAWEGVQRLEAQAHLILAHLETGAPRPETTEHFSAWWQAPAYWRHDKRNAVRVNSYRSAGAQWCLVRNGHLLQQGTVADAERQALTQHDLLYYGRPYLSPQQNAHLWFWLNAALWAVSYDLVVNEGYTPTPTPTTEAVVHLLAGVSFTHDSGHVVHPDRPRLRAQWNIHAWDRETEILDYANFFQLWVDMNTGFCSRITAEGEHGRMWELVLDRLVINGPTIPLTTFRPDPVGDDG